MAANRLAVDIELINRTKRDYENAVSNMRQAIANLEKAMSYLENSGWKSGASRAYFSRYEDKWKTSMETHITALEHLESCLNFAVSEYSEVEERASRLAQYL